MVADIIVKDETRDTVKGRFVSTHKTTVREILDSIGDGILTRVEDEIIYARLDLPLEAGTYTWSKRQRQQREDGDRQEHERNRSVGKISPNSILPNW